VECLGSMEVSLWRSTLITNKREAGKGEGTGEGGERVTRTNKGSNVVVVLVRLLHGYNLPQYYCKTSKKKLKFMRFEELNFT
jgi:hypothetical protein